jgi:hypothetical protein
VDKATTWSEDPEIAPELAAQTEIYRGAVLDMADVNAACAVTLDDFYAYMPTHTYLYAPTHAMWPGASVNARIPPVPAVNSDRTAKLDQKGKPVFLPAAAWLDRNRPVEQLTWVPGEPMVIADRMPMLEGGWIERSGARTFNLYKGPIVEPGDPSDAQRWIDHVRLVYPDDAEHLLDWFAHRVQRPGEKINHAIVLGGDQGIGKDSLIAPVRYAVAPWNCQEASPAQVMGRFNGYVKSVILRISEARDLGDADRFKFYDHTKTIEAAPPEFLRVDEKNMREYPVLNCCGVIITTNHKADGIYLPAEDRRHYVAWSDLTMGDARLGDNYWNRLHTYYDKEGNRAVAAYLRKRDISKFDPKAPPPKTAAFWAIVDASRAPEEAELADILDKLGNPNAVTLIQLQRIADNTDGELAEWLNARCNRRTIPHRLDKCGYAPVRNPDAPADGDWKIGGKRQVVYGKKTLVLKDQISAARALVR